MSRFLELAYSHLKYADYGMTVLMEETDLNIAAYHLYKATTGVVKGCLELEGKDMTSAVYQNYTPDLLIEELGSTYAMPTALKTYVVNFHEWQLNSNYNFELFNVKRKLEIIYKLVYDWLGEILIQVQFYPIKVENK